MSEQSEHSGDTPVELQTLLRALRGMEAIDERLGSEAPQDWRQDVRAELRSVSAAIGEHTRASESPNGLLTEVERQIGHPRSLTEAHSAHDQLTAEVDAIAGLVEEGTDISTVRERCKKVQIKLQQHIDVMGELLYDATLEPESGIGD